MVNSLLLERSGFHLKGGGGGGVSATQFHRHYTFFFPADILIYGARFLAIRAGPYGAMQEYSGTGQAQSEGYAQTGASSPLSPINNNNNSTQYPLQTQAVNPDWQLRNAQFRGGQAPAAASGNDFASMLKSMNSGNDMLLDDAVDHMVAT